MSVYREYITAATPEWVGLPKGKSQGKIGARFGNMVMSTPNARHMKLPLYGHDITVLLRTDFKFGLPDPICGPQPYHAHNAHLACMIAPTMEYDFHHLFRPFLTQWWTPLPGNPNLGKLDTEIVLTLSRKGNAWAKDILQQVEDIKKGTAGTTLRIEDISVDKLEPSIWRLKRLWITLRRPATLEELQWRYVNAQRLELNLRSHIDFEFIYSKRFKNPPEVPLLTNNGRMGAMTTHYPTAQMLYHCGLPVW
ncbi:hypothetical protein CYLTODRAFT_121314 [Cylindrobasidium torrendii FP15055 ss-10]|uniref:Uncharacterized protein n=1 Tax=Cylindrobasidium torrendii FP15055 ss-10 TaxID=1314674 RepID=A0A0D7B2W4_9AGAR|nr:hypothetical protein CYLTODRAFT_121314 [Cylindrobasidium torrendii FP15055 ss-10]